ncbi:MAG: HAD-IIA family hydrolase [Ilumatobacter sp.]
MPRDASSPIDGRRVDTLLCDLDGVVWLAHEPIPGAVDAIARIRSSGARVLFVTNNSASLLGTHEAALAEIGIDASGDVVSSAMAGAFLVGAGERVLVTGGPGVVEAVEARGADAVLNVGDEAVLDDPFDAVLVGLHRDFDYARLRVAGRAIHAGARLIGTNGDSTYPTTDGLDPGGGAILRAVEAVGGVEAIIAGKPEQPMAALVLDLVGGGPDTMLPDTMLMVGDRPETDGLFADRLGCRFALVESGVTVAGAGTHADLASVIDELDR